MKHGLSSLVAALLLTGCLNVHTTVVLNRDGSGSLEINYEVDAELYYLGVFDDSDGALPVPISRDQFEDAADRIPGVSLRRYRVHEEIGVITVSAQVLFDSVEALNLWYGGPGDAISMTQEGDITVWRQLLYRGGGTQGDVGVALGESLEAYRISYLLDPASDVLSAGVGKISNDAGSAFIEMSLKEIVTAASPTFWEVTW